MFARQVLATTRRVAVKSTTFGLVIGLSGAGLYFADSRTIRLDTVAVAGTSVHHNQPTSNTEHPVTAAVDKLRQNEQSHFPQSGSGISRYDVVHVASNNPIEDDHCEATLPVPSGFWSLFAVLDGHNGWQTSAWLRERIIPAVVGAVGDVYTKHESEPEVSTQTTNGRPQPPPHAIDDAIKNAFKQLDDDIVHTAVEKVFSTQSKATAIELLAPAHAGSCALLALYDSQDRSLRVALTGDSRAVLGRRTARPLPANGDVINNGNDNDHTNSSEVGDFYEVHVLSVDQTGNNPAEETRMNALHPGETLVEKGRVLGWGISRAFGDAAYKWSIDIQKRLHEEYLGDRPRPDVKTPPYFTAEPEVTTTEVRPGDFLIMATDGLWDSLTNEEAVGLIGLWLNDNRKALTKGEGRSQVAAAPAESGQLPVTAAEDRTVMYPYWRTKKRFVKVDDNAATHLTRNALGGADSDLTAGLLKMTLPRARRYRDDITAIVVFFDE